MTQNKIYIGMYSNQNYTMTGSSGDASMHNLNVSFFELYFPSHTLHLGICSSGSLMF